MLLQVVGLLWIIFYVPINRKFSSALTMKWIAYLHSLRSIPTRYEIQKTWDGMINQIFHFRILLVIHICCSVLTYASVSFHSLKFENKCHITLISPLFLSHQSDSLKGRLVLDLTGYRLRTLYPALSYVSWYIDYWGQSSSSKPDK